MNFEYVALFISLISKFFIYVVIASSLLSFFLDPYHPIREALDRIVNPFLDPIRRLLPKAGGLDFSPLILIIVVDLISRFLVAFFLSLS